MNTNKNILTLRYKRDFLWASIITDNLYAIYLGPYFDLNIDD